MQHFLVNILNIEEIQTNFMKGNAQLYIGDDRGYHIRGILV